LPDGGAAFARARRDGNPVACDRVLSVTRFVYEPAGKCRDYFTCRADNDVLIALLDKHAGRHQVRLAKLRKLILKRSAPAVSFEHVEFLCQEPNWRRRRNFRDDGELGCGAAEGRLDNVDHLDASLICAARRNYD
jgi:hypothetical protein